MGLGFNSVHLLSRTLKRLGDLSDKKLLIVGVQDCYYNYDQLLRFLKRHRIPHQPLAADEVELTTSFKWMVAADAARHSNCIHQNSLFATLGFAPSNIHSMDASEYEGADIVHDLNNPVDASLEAAFDLIVDGGTAEHIFSIKDALFNLCRMCKVGGVVVGINPVDTINHGFVNFNAEIFRDCFLSNGFEEITLKYWAYPTNPRSGARHYLEYAPPEKLAASLRPYYATAVYSAYLKIENRSLKVPQQGVYQNLWTTGPVHAPEQTSRLRALIPRWAKERFISSPAQTFINMRRGKKVRL